MNHKDLEAWKQAMSLVELVYTRTEQLPAKEQFGLQSQMRRAAVSIPSNIAEGAARKSDKEFIQFLYIALGSSAELETQLILSNRLFQIEATDLLNEIEKCRKLFLGLIRYLKSKGS